MRAEELIQVQGARPFQAYRIHMSDGRHFDVAHPDFLARSPSGRSAILYKLDETFEIIDLLHVSSLEVRNGNDGSSAGPKPT